MERTGAILTYCKPQSLLTKALILIYLFGFYEFQAKAQTQQQEDSIKFRKYDIFPAISYSPETKLTLGVIGYRYLDLSKSDPETTRSYINFVAVYTTTNQAIVESNWELFTDGNKLRFRGGFTFARFPDRNYGFGNDAGALVLEYKLNNTGIEDTVVQNFKRFSVMRFGIRPSVLREISNQFYVGLNADVEYVWNFEELADSINILKREANILLLQDNTLGLRSGMGFNIVWDSRDNILNSSSGSFVYLSTLFFGKYLGSDYRYISTRLDARTYFNPVLNHTIAVRGLLNFRFTDDVTLPLRGLSRVGGGRFVRGYFQGTYQNNNMVAFETEYRLPFWNEDNIAPFRKFWKRLGLVVFLSGAQVFGERGSFGMDRFNLAAGGGLRVLFSEDSKVNLRIDYGVGLAADSNGPGKRQSGLYFFLAEAF